MKKDYRTEDGHTSFKLKTSQRWDMTKTLIKVLIPTNLLVLLAAMLWYLSVPDNKVRTYYMLQHYEAAILALVPYVKNNQISVMLSDGDSIRNYPGIIAALLEPNARMVMDALIKDALYSTLANWVIGITGFIGYFMWIAKKNSYRHIRGPQLDTEANVAKAIAKSGKPCMIPLTTTVSLPVEYENRHGLIVGKQGGGKTQLLMRLFYALRGRGDKNVVVYGPKADLLAILFRPGIDLVFNFLDKRSLKWTLFNEIKCQPDCVTMAATLIPEGEDRAEVYWGGARCIFAEILWYLWQKGSKTNKDLLAALMATRDEMKKMLAGTIAFNYIETKEFGGILAKLQRRTEFLRYMADGDFSIDNWLANPRGWIYISSVSRVKEVMKPALSLFIDLIAARVTSLDEDIKRRVWFILDEFGSLQPLRSVIDLITQARSKGGCVWIAIQDLAQAAEAYGEELIKSIVGNLATSAIFSTEDPDLAEFMSKKISEAEIERQQRGTINRIDGPSGTTSTRRESERLVIAGQIIKLPDLHFYCKVPGENWFPAAISYQDYPNVHPAYEEADVMRPVQPVPDVEAAKHLEDPDLPPVDIFALPKNTQGSSPLDPGTKQ